MAFPEKILLLLTRDTKRFSNLIVNPIKIRTYPKRYEIRKYSVKDSPVKNKKAYESGFTMRLKGTLYGEKRDFVSL